MWQNLGVHAPRFARGGVLEFEPRAAPPPLLGSQGLLVYLPSFLDSIKFIYKYLYLHRDPLLRLTLM
jgi:hypothetical protein